MNNSKINSLNVNLIFDKIKVAFGLSSDQDLANFLNVKPSTLSMQRRRGTLDVTRIIEKCQKLDFNWLFRSDHLDVMSAADPVDVSGRSILHHEKQDAYYNAYDLINENAMLRKIIREKDMEIYRLKSS